MSGGLLVQTDVAFVRLDSGEVAQLSHGDPLPENVLAAEVERLTAAGVVGEPVSTDKPRGSRS